MYQFAQFLTWMSIFFVSFCFNILFYLCDSYGELYLQDPGSDWERDKKVSEAPPLPVPESLILSFINLLEKLRICFHCLRERIIM